MGINFIFLLTNRWEEISFSLNLLTNEAFDLKTKRGESSTYNKSFKPYFKKNTNPMDMSAQIPNVVFNVENLELIIIVSVTQ